ncbi:ABC transporter ATP-binding protein [Bowdeniella nasicola]|uniref:ABC transporter ATP-binding protein n=1 Tax=Bowdeniella nasicola TaxID=208480 RepID=UPI001161058B
MSLDPAGAYDNGSFAVGGPQPGLSDRLAVRRNFPRASRGAETPRLDGQGLHAQGDAGAQHRTALARRDSRSGRARRPLCAPVLRRPKAAHHHRDGARAQPALIVADEPTSALDVSVQAAVLDLFLQLQQEFGFACLFISHDLAVIDEVSHSIVVMYRGEILEQGVAREVLQRPTHPYTQRLLAALPVPDPVAKGERRE